jgi:hypothetical protein
MSMRVNTEMIPAEIAAECDDIGRTWAAQEFDIVSDEGRRRQEWVSGEYNGDLPGLKIEDEDTEDERRLAIEQLIDDAARATWNSLWDASEATR